MTDQMKIKVVRSKRRTVSMEIKGGCDSPFIVVRAPLKMKDEDLGAFVEKHRGWAEKKIAEIRKRAEEIKAEEPTVRKLTEDEIEELKRAAKEYFNREVAILADLMGVSYGRITVRMQKTRWGSCSRKGNLNFNCLLMLAPEPVRRSVTVHELCHRRELNHSRRFKELEVKYMPDYKQQEKWLKEHGRELMSRAGFY